jgi:hypothetical protein
MVGKEPIPDEVLTLETGVAELVLANPPWGNAIGEDSPTLLPGTTKLTDWIPIPRPREDSAHVESIPPHNTTPTPQHTPPPSTPTRTHSAPTSASPSTPARTSSVLYDLPTQIIEFKPSHLIAETTLRHLPPKTRVIVTCRNAISAHKDMAHLAQLWRRAVPGSPCVAIVKILDPLSRLSETHARKLCTDLLQGLRSYEEWGEKVKVSRESEEGSMCAAWWEGFDKEVGALGTVDVEDVRAQLEAIGGRFLNCSLVEAGDQIENRDDESDKRFEAADAELVAEEGPEVAVSPTSPILEEPQSDDDFLYPRTPPEIPRRRTLASFSLPKARAPLVVTHITMEDTAVRTRTPDDDADDDTIRIADRFGRRNKQRRMPLPDTWRAQGIRSPSPGRTREGRLERCGSENGVDGGDEDWQSLLKLERAYRHQRGH